MTFKKYRVIVGFFLLFSTSCFAVGQITPTINNKPITIDADQQNIDIQKNTITFTGNVVIVQEGFTVNADKVVITEMQDKDKQKITGYGKPVYFKQLMADPKKNISGHADKLIYNVKENTIILIGRAELVQQDSRIKSAQINYDVAKETIVARSGKGNRVKTIMIPNQIQNNNNKLIGNK